MLHLSVRRLAASDAVCAWLQVPDFAHVTNQDDPVPNVPPQFLEFQHPPGELHIEAVDDKTGDAQVVACPGQENDVSFASEMAVVRQVTGN